MATPHASGALALVYGYHPGFTYQQVRDAIFSTVRPLASLAGITVTGGIIDVAAALGDAPPPPPQVTYHLSGLSGYGMNVSSTKWNAVVMVSAHDANNQPVAGVTVSGSWSNGAKGTGSCTTAATGSCTITKNSLARNKVASVVFTLTSVTHATFLYDPAGNHNITNPLTILRP
jgi:hypothetical protein